MSALRNPYWRVLAAGGGYFCLVFAIGFVLGIVRVLWLQPWLGVRNAELAELPVMVWASAQVAIWTCRVCRVPAQSGPRLAMGAIGLSLLLAMELLLVPVLRGQTLPAYFAARDPLSTIAYALALLAFALWPWWFARRGRGARFLPEHGGPR